MRKYIFDIYRYLAVTLLNVILIFTILNLISGAILLIRDKKGNRINDYTQRFPDIYAYTQFTPKEALGYLKEQERMRNIPVEYEPWVQFRNPEFHGRLINTDKYGFRISRKPKVLSGNQIKVYVFGGSTTFGYGISDNDTIPSYMQKILEEKYPGRAILVKNFGQTCYYSSQELVLFLRFIKEKDLPDWAIFIDGLNDTNQLSRLKDEPWFTPQVKSIWHNRKMSLLWLPIVKVLKGTALNENKPPGAGVLKETTEYIVSHYLDNIKIINHLCSQNRIKCLFIWQPVPFYSYNASLHRSFPVEIDGAHWQKVYAYFKNNKPNENFLFLGEIFKDSSEKIYVDDVHYNEIANEKIAKEICSYIKID